MVIRTTTTLINNVYTASISTEPSSNEVAFMEAYGEPSIDIGGVINYTDAESVPSTITLPSIEVSIRSNSPFVQSFDAKLDAQAEYERTGWIAAILADLTAVMVALMANSPPNSPNVVVTEI